jgi:hypothetical protein
MIEHYFQIKGAAATRGLMFDQLDDLMAHRALRDQVVMKAFL